MIDKDIVVTLDNNLEYGVIETQIVDNVQYALLVNINNKKDVKINKVIEDELGIALQTLDSQEEFIIVYPHFYSKMKKFVEKVID